MYVRIVSVPCSVIFVFKQKTAYDMRISDRSSDVCSSDLAGTQQGVEGVLTYLLVYMLTTLGAFLVVLQLRDADGNYVESIPALAGLSQRRPGLAAAMAVFLFSLAGIPPLFGFWPKYLV